MKMKSIHSNKMTSYYLKIISRTFYPAFFIWTNPNSSKTRRVFSILLNWTVFLCQLNAVTNTLYLLFRNIEKIELRYTLTALMGVILSTGIRTVIIIKFHVIVAAVQQISIIHSDLLRKKVGKVYIITAFFGGCIIPYITYLTFKINRFRKVETELDHFQKYTFFGITWQSVFATYLAVFWRFVRYTQYQVLPYCCVALCCYSFKLFNEAIKHVERKIKKKSDIRDIFYYSLEMTQKLAKCSEGIKTALSIILFLLCCSLISNIFIHCTILISSQQKEEQKVIMHRSFSILTSLLAFYAISLQAAFVHESAINLKKAVYSSSAKFTFSTCNRYSGSCCLLLTMANELEAKLQITAWDFFPLNRRFILESSGAMLTYSVIIWQMTSLK